MEKWQQEHITKNHSTLIQYTHCTVTLLSKLKEREIISANEMEELLAVAVPFDQSRQLYRILEARQNTYNIMQQILIEEKQTGAASVFQKGHESQLAPGVELTYNKLKLLGRGCKSTKVFEGKFGATPVAVKVLNCDEIDVEMAKQEVQQLVNLVNSTVENIVRYFCSVEQDGCLLIALELCKCNLFECITEKLHSISVGELLQITKGLDFLHSAGNGILHLDLKPENILIKIENGSVKLKIADFGVSKIIPAVDRSDVTVHTAMGKGTFGWMAPELLREDDNDTRKIVATKAADIFSLGCVYYFVASNGKHPFGERIRCVVHILDKKHQMNVSQFQEHLLDYYWLIRAMINHNYLERPTTNHLLNHLVHWTSEKKVRFIAEIGFLLENNVGSIKTCFANYVSYLQNVDKAKPVINNEWVNWLCTELKRYVETNILHLNPDEHSSAENLILVITKLYNNYTRLPEPVKDSLGDMHDDFLVYWTSRFPYLLSTLWTQLDQMKTEARLQPFYNDSSFTDCYKLADVQAALSESFQVPGKQVTFLHKRNRLIQARRVVNTDMETISESSEETYVPERQDSIGFLLQRVTLKDIQEENNQKIAPSTGSDSLNMALQAICNNDMAMLDEACSNLEKDEQVLITEIWKRIDENLSGTVLHFAVREGCANSVNYLLEQKGFDKSLDAEMMCDILHVCVKNTLNLNSTDVQSRQAIVEAILKINITLVDETNDLGETPLHMQGIHFELLSLLIQHGGNIYAKTLREKTVIHTATESCFSAEYFHQLVVLTTTENPEIFGTRSKSGRLAMHYAVSFFEVNSETLDILNSINQLNLNTQDNKGNSIFLQAVVGGRSAEYLGLLCDSFNAERTITDFGGRNALHLAAMYGNIDAVQYFITECPAFLETCDYMNRTPLHCTFLQDHKFLLEVAEMLISGGVQINARTHEALGYKTALHVLIELTGKLKTDNNLVCITKVMRFLIDSGADLDIKNSDGNTVLHLAFEVSPPDIILHLISMTQSISQLINAKNNKGDTPLHGFFGRKDLVQSSNAVIVQQLCNILPDSFNFNIRNNLNQSILELAEFANKKGCLDEDTLDIMRSFKP